MGAAGAKALLAAVPLQRARGVKPLWLRVEWNQIDEAELRRYIEQVCCCALSDMSAVQILCPCMWFATSLWSGTRLVRQSCGLTSSRCAVVLCLQL
jgi:hypothetical protein